MKKLLAALAVLALAVPALAGIVNKDIVAWDGSGRNIDGLYTHCTGDSVQFVYSVKGTATVDTLDLNIALSYPGRFVFHFPAEANALTAWFRFKEIDDGKLTSAYTWGDWFPVLLSNARLDDEFRIGLAESLQMCVVGSAYGVMDIYYRIEEYRD